MSIWLGNITFDQVEDKLGYKLTEEDRIVWNKYHSEKAELPKDKSTFHVFDIPRCIHFRGNEAKEVILKMFTPDKIVKRIGQFMVYEDES